MTLPIRCWPQRGLGHKMAGTQHRRGFQPVKKCDYCNKPAVVHETTVRSGVAKEIHLCRDCAQKAGVVIPIQPKPTEMLQQFVIATAAVPSRKSPRSHKLTCENCGTTFQEFRHTGTLGCPSCYEAFDKELAPMIERAQSGAIHHAGKTPRNGDKSVDRAAQIGRLLRELNSAVAAEQYERAAELRDRLGSIERDSASTPTATPTTTTIAGAGTGTTAAGASAGATKARRTTDQERSV